MVFVQFCFKISYNEYRTDFYRCNNLSTGLKVCTTIFRTFQETFEHISSFLGSQNIYFESRPHGDLNRVEILMELHTKGNMWLIFHEHKNGCSRKKRMQPTNSLLQSDQGRTLRKLRASWLSVSDIFADLQVSK